MPLGSPASCLSPSPEATGGPTSLLSLAHLCPLSRSHCPPPPAWLSAFVPPVPPGQPGPSSCLAQGSAQMAPGPGSQARIPQGSWARQELCSFTHCSLPSPQGRGACCIRQQTYQGLRGCQALAGTPSHPQTASEALPKEPTTLLYQFQPSLPPLEAFAPADCPPQAPPRLPSATHSPDLFSQGCYHCLNECTSLLLLPFEGSGV